MKIFRQTILVFLLLIALYVLLLTTVYTIPDAWITDHVESALGVLDAEGAYPQYFFGYPFGQADNNTDREMYRNLLRNDSSSVLHAAMVPHYARYWHGYAVLLRPLSVFLSLTNIRYLHMMVILLLLCLCFLEIAQQIHTAAAITFMLGLAASFLWLAPFNMQYFTVTALTLLFSWIVMRLHRRKRHTTLPFLFLCFGSLTFFFDYLTFPVLTLGYPLILVLLLRKQDLQARTFPSELLILLSCTASWFAGYALTILAKGGIGTLVLGSNVMQEIFENSLYRINGALPCGYTTTVSAWMAIRYNADVFFNVRNSALLIVCVLCLLITIARRRSAIKGWASSLPILGAALLPYVWYAVLENHSIVHCYFTYKAQAVTFFGICAYLLSLIDFSHKPSRFA